MGKDAQLHWYASFKGQRGGRCQVRPKLHGFTPLRFLQLGLFPEDQAVSTRKLLLPWIAEGLVIQQDQQRMADVAEDYLNELINRNLFE